MAGVFDLINPAALTETPTVPPSEFTKGLRSGGSGAMSALNNLGGAVGEALGASDFARDRYAAADVHAADAAAAAPRVSSFRDVRGLRDAGDYVAGLAGGMVPVGVPALAATALTGGGAIPAIAAGTAVMAPVEVGDVVGRQRAAGRPVSLRDAGLAGGASAVIQNVLPGVARGALSGAARIPGGSLAAIPEQAALAAGGEGIKQVGGNPDAPLDFTQIGDAAAAGGVMGVPIAGMNALGTRGAAISEGVGKAKDALGGAATALKSKAQGAAQGVADSAPVQAAGDKLAGYDIPQQLGEVFDGAKAKAREVRDKIANSEDIIGDAKQFLGASGEKLQALIKGDDGERLTRVQEYANELLKSKLDPEQAAKLTAAMQNLGDTANQAVVAGMSKARAGFDTARSQIDAFAEKVAKRRGELKDGGTKKSEDTSGIRDVILKEVMPVIQKARPELFDGGTSTERTETLNKLGDHLRQAFETAASGKPFDSDLIASMIDIAGSKAADVLDAVHRAVGETDAKRTAATFRVVNQLADSAASRDSLAKVMRDNLVAGKTLDPGDISRVSRLLTDWANTTQKGDDPQAMFKDRKVRELLKEQFGDNAEKVLAAVEQNRKTEANALEKASRVTDEEGNVLSEVPANEGLTEFDPGDGTKVSLHTGKDGLMYLHPDHHEGKFAPAALRRIEKLKAESPDANPRLMSAADLGEDHPLVQKMRDELTKRARTAGVDPARIVDSELEKYVVVSVERSDNPQALTPDELRAMKLDRHKYGDSKSRIDTGDNDVVLDAVKVTRAMQGRFKDEYTASDDGSRMTRLGRMFIEGIAAAQAQLGRSFDIPDSTVIGRLGKDGKVITWADVKRFDPRTEKDRADDADTMTLVEMRKAYREASANEKARIRKEAGKIVEKKEGKVAAEQQDRPDMDPIPGQEADPFGETHQALGGRNDDSGQIHTGISGLPRGFEGGAVKGLTARAPADKELPPPKEPPRRLTFSERAAVDRMTAAENFGALKTRDQADNFLAAARKRYDELLVADRKAVADGVRLVETQQKALAVLEDMFGPKATRDLNSFYDGMPPDPKVVAAKKAAFLERARSGDKALLTEIASSDDVKGMQRALAALKPTDSNTLNTINALNRRLMELVTRDTPDTSYGMQTQRYSLQPTSTATTNANLADRTAVRDYIGKVLGPQIKIAWAKLKHAGEFERIVDQQGGVEDIIRISVHSLNPMSVAYHESLHAFMQRLSDLKRGDVMEVLNRAAESAPVLNQIKRIMADRGYSKEAVAQLANREERAAYMFQFWADGALKVGDQTKGVLGRIADFIRSVLGVWSNDERALHIMDYFHRGDFADALKKRDASAEVYQATMLPNRNRVLETARRMAEPLSEVGEALAVAGGQRLRDTGIPALRELADAMKLHGTAEGTDAGFLPAARNERARVMNELAVGLKRFSTEARDAALESLQSKSNAPIDALARPEDRLAAREAKKVVRATLDQMFEYMRAAKVKVNDLGVGKDYFPRVYDTSYISAHQTQFKALLAKHGVTNPDGTMKRIMVTDGAEFTVERDMPGMQHLKPRDLAFIPDAELAPFLRKDLLYVMSSYVTQATRRAEWARRFGDDGSKLTDMLKRAKEQGASTADIDAGQKYIRAVDGTLGDTINPEARRLFGNMIVYQNIRLLPLAIFSSVVDPLGIMVRGGTVGESFAAFKRGVREVTKNFKQSTDDEATKLAATLGTIDDSSLVHTLGALYSQGMVGDTGRKINDAFFRFNLMEQYNTSMRVAATEAALGFIARHADGKASPHSVRWLNELGLQVGDVKLDANGRPKLFEADGLTLDESARMKAAVNRWVDGAVLRPDAADKPLWMSDPHWALFAHLKQFTYSFHETILKRVAHEYQNGNYTPAMALASYVPMMIAADTIKGMIQGGGSQPEWKEGWGVDEYVMSGAERAGLFGVGQFGIDALKDVQRGGSGVGALAGPTVEQLLDAVRVIGGDAHFGSFALKSMPANALYAGAFDGETADPVAAE